MVSDRPIHELADRARAACNRLLRRHALADRRELHDRCAVLDTRILLNTPVAEARFVVLDLETTGFGAYAGDEIVQFALIEYEGLAATGREYCSLVRPSIPIPPTATAVHGIDDRIVSDAPSIADVIDKILNFLDESVIVGHHVAFDLRFLNRVTQRELFCRLPHPVIDTMLLYLSHSGRLGHYELEDVAASCGVTPGKRHDARGDAVTAGRIFARMAAPAAEAGRSAGELIADMRTESPDAPERPPT